ncbi:predicted protein [Botrytis cinerea T4]|uniref:Uncharacterized protein n=1 Tax=Botryotinia fuckeliana (strain T4) TaxID=999810 RepID=G2Y1M2_BOTF4|nr:predicted protein [Botrytis cinerea T4]
MDQIGPSHSGNAKVPKILNLRSTDILAAACCVDTGDVPTSFGTNLRGRF